MTQSTFLWKGRTLEKWETLDTPIWSLPETPVQNETLKFRTVRRSGLGGVG